MKNITLAVDEAVLEKVKIVAAQERTTVNAMVRKFLEEKAKGSDVAARRRAAIERMLELSRNSKVQLPEGWKFNREELYAERLSRFERRALRGGRAEGEPSKKRNRKKAD